MTNEWSFVLYLVAMCKNNTDKKDLTRKTSLASADTRVHAS
jgi:hypothetical protein